MEDIFSDFESLIPDSMTHWQHPRFFGYFPCNSAPAAQIGDALANGLSSQCMLWQTSPAATELEIRMVDWLRQSVGLPASFVGSFQDTASLDVESGSTSDYGSLANQVADRQEQEPGQVAEGTERRHLLLKMLHSLEQNQATVIQLRYGFSDGEGRSLAEVGRQMNMTRDRVRQIEKDAFEKLVELNVSKLWQGEHGEQKRAS